MKRLPTRLLLSAVLGTGLCVAAPVLADDDTSADAQGGFSMVQESQGAMIRVPINQRGEELTDQAELRVHTGSVAPSANELKETFDDSTSVAGLPQVSESDVNSDTSTNWGWGRYRYAGWRYNYYYSYRPYFYYSNYYYRYSNPYYYNYYGYNPYGYYGYRYYYYPRYYW